MSNVDSTSEQTGNELYTYAANLVVIEGKNPDEIKAALIEKGLSNDAAYTIMASVKDQLQKEKKAQAGKDILYGALWCIGGTIATLANIGFIFWGAILFGGIQLIKGLYNYYKE